MWPVVARLLTEATNWILLGFRPALQERIQAGHCRHGPKHGQGTCWSSVETLFCDCAVRLCSKDLCCSQPCSDKLLTEVSSGQCRDSYLLHECWEWVTMGAQHRWDTLPTQVAESGKNGPARGLGGELWQAVFCIWRDYCIQELTVAVITWTRSVQDQATQKFQQG